MLDIKRIRTNKEEVIESLNSRFGNYNIDKVLELDEKRREIIFEVENKKARQNEVSKQVPKLKKDGVDVSDLFKEMKALSDEIKELDVKVKDLDEEIRKELLSIPNTPNKDIPIGKSDEDNVEIRKFLEPKLDCPATKVQVLGRMLLEILLFRSLWRNTKATKIGRAHV